MDQAVFIKLPGVITINPVSQRGLCMYTVSTFLAYLTSLMLGDIEFYVLELSNIVLWESINNGGSHLLLIICQDFHY